MSAVSVIVVMLSLPVFLVAPAAQAQDFPNKPIRVIVPAPGGGSDFAARILAQAIAGPLGQQVVIDYRGGGVVSTDYVAKSAPDGYTLHVTGGLLWLQPLLRPSPYDALRDFATISLLCQEPGIVAVHPSLPVKSIKELIALAKTHPGQLNYASTGVGATSHLVPELFKSMAGVNIVHVPYKGSLARMTAMLSGEVQMAILDTSAVGSQIQARKIRALTVTSSTPAVLFPDLPTVAASGVPGFESVGRTGIWAPSKTPEPVVNRLNQEIIRALGQASVKEQFLKSGVEPVGSTPEQFTSIIKSEIARMGKVIKDANIKAE